MNESPLTDEVIAACENADLIFRERGTRLQWQKVHILEEILETGLSSYEGEEDADPGIYWSLFAESGGESLLALRRTITRTPLDPDREMHTRNSFARVIHIGKNKPRIARLWLVSYLVLTGIDTTIFVGNEYGVLEFVLSAIDSAMKLAKKWEEVWQGFPNEWKNGTAQPDDSPQGVNFSLMDHYPHSPFRDFRLQRYQEEATLWDNAVSSVQIRGDESHTEWLTKVKFIVDRMAQLKDAATVKIDAEWCTNQEYQWQLWPVNPVWDGTKKVAGWEGAALLTGYSASHFKAYPRLLPGILEITGAQKYHRTLIYQLLFPQCYELCQEAKPIAAYVATDMVAMLSGTIDEWGKHVSHETMRLSELPETVVTVGSTGSNASREVYPEITILAAEGCDRIIKAVEGLTPALRETAYLMIEGYEDKEIAEIMGKTWAAIRKNKERVRKELKHFAPVGQSESE